MQSMSTINRLWSDGKLPCGDGLYFATGESYAARLNSELPCGLEILETLDLDAAMAEHPNRVTTPGTSGVSPLPNGDALWFGEASWGSEGFFARVAPGEELVWVVYLLLPNPFHGVELNGDPATFHSTAEFTITVNVNQAQKPLTNR